MLSAIILAAGQGKRLGGRVSKPLVRINNLPVIIYSLSTLNQHPKINEIIVVASIDNQDALLKLIKGNFFKKVKTLVLGGKRRQDSVSKGLKEVSSQSDWVLIHDSARPFIDRQAISRVILAAKKTNAAILAVKLKATIKISQKNNIVKQTLDRNSLWEIQTPQVFRKELILEAYKKFRQEEVTDDASLVEKLGKPVLLVQGSYQNIKITTGEDLLFAGLIAKRSGYAV